MRTLDRRIDIERKSVTPNAHGDPIETWTKIATRRPAAVMPVRGDERFSADQFISRQQVKFLIRHSTNVENVSPLDRIVYPPDASSPPVPPEDQIYDIVDVPEKGRREGLVIIAVRRSEIQSA